MRLTFDQLLAPTSVEAFCREFFAKRTLLVRGAPDKFRDVFSLARFQEILARGWPASVYARAVFDGKGGEESDPSLEVDAKGAVAAYEAGATVCINRLDSFLPDIAELCAHVRLRLGYPGEVGVHAYWSPDGAGFRPHFDARIATTLQIDGRKTWRLGRQPVLAWPLTNARIVGESVRYDGRAECEPWEAAIAEGAFEYEDVTLDPGDLLCVPAGVVHAAEASGSSLALNLHFNPVDASVYIGRLLGHAFLDRADWRAVAPLLVDGADAARRDLAQRLREAATHLQSLAEGVTLRQEVATELVGALTTAVAARAPMTLPRPLDATSALRAGAIAVLEDEPLTVVAPGAKVEVREPGARLLRAVLARPGVTIAEVARSEAEVRELVTIATQMEEARLVRR